MKNILLVNPPVSIYHNKTAFAPLPLLVLGSCLKQIKESGTAISYELLDLDLMIKQGKFADDESFYQDAGDLIIKNNPDLLLFTVHGPNHLHVLKIAHLIKQQRPCLIIVGGVGPSLSAVEAIGRCPDIDMIVKGEGEPVLEPLIEAFLKDGDYSHVPSIVYRENNQIIDNPRKFLDLCEPIPCPDYSLIQIEDYIEHNQTHPYIHPGFVLIESGRGCIYNCSFCAPKKMWGQQARYRPVDTIIEEMNFLASKGGVFSFFTQDNLDEDFLVELSEALITRGSKTPWGCYSRLDQLSEELAENLAKSGCNIIFTGMETPNLDTQKKIHKIIDSNEIFTKLKIYNKAGIRLIGSFIAGFSGETEEELENTMRFAIECTTGKTYQQLQKFVDSTDPQKLPQAPDNICVIHPMVHMVGTDSFYEEFDKLHISKYSSLPDGYGSYLFGYENFKEDWSFLGTNPYLSHLSDDEARQYFSIFRLFNFLNSRPYFFTLLLQTKQTTPLTLLKKMVQDFSEDFIVSAKINLFENKARDYVAKHLDFVPLWTVKKGQ